MPLQDQRLAAVEESVKEMNSMLNGADDTAILTALMSQVHFIITMMNSMLNGADDTAILTALMSQVISSQFVQKHSGEKSNK